MTAEAQPAPGHPVFTWLVRTLGRMDARVAWTERAVTVAALLAIVAVVFLQAVLRYLSGALPLGEWLDPQRFLPPPDAALGLLDRLGLLLRRAAATGYDIVVRGGGEIARYSMVWAAVLGASVATRERRHIAVDAVARILEQRGRVVAKEWLTVAGAAIATLITLYLARAGWVLLGSAPIQFRESTALGIPIKYVALALPLGLGIMALRFLGVACSGTLANLGLIDPQLRYRGGGGLQALIAEYQKRPPDAGQAQGL
ncbi:MAG: TRAP transporter small permease subunit [Gemmatimonadetes bacterium]|nr:TRAP transporter small permease subunit [Gemmatimonadota bacterium]